MNDEANAHDVAYAVVVCSRCQTAYSVELRHKTSHCPRCPEMVDLRRRRRLWQGDDAMAARQAAASLNSALAQGRSERDAAAAQASLQPVHVPRHDSPIDAAAAQARSVTNASQKAELVALWLTRLVGEAPDADYLAALEMAGLSRERAERELVRMLACDVIFEPRAGWYRSLGS